MLGPLRPKVGQPGRSANVQGAFSRIDKVALLHGYVSGAALELDGRAGRETWLALEPAARD